MRLPWPFARRRPRTAIDLFCGAAGGWGLGLHWAGVRVSAAVELDDQRADAYRARWGVPVLGDVAQLTARDFRAHPNPWLVCGSPPCKGISEVNHKGKGVDDDGLFFEAIRLAVDLRPAWISLENVSRLRTRGADRVLERLEQAGYAAETLVVGSDAAGKDHGRQRVFIVASDTRSASDAKGGEGRPARQPWAPPFRPAAEWPWILLGPESRRRGLGRLRAGALGRHLRAYDGVSAGVAEFARRAYGDALDPVFPLAIARALIAWEEGRVAAAVAA